MKERAASNVPIVRPSLSAIGFVNCRDQVIGCQAAAIVPAFDATGEEPETLPDDDGKDPAAKALGKKGGAARAKGMTPERRAEIAQRRQKSDGKTVRSPAVSFVLRASFSAL
jgi:hypothetical protein